MKNPKKILALDVETANEKRASICSLGVVLYINGQLKEERYYLIDPETDFLPRNIGIHGITPEMVSGEKTFPEVWPEIQPLFDGSLVVAHNAASMDLNAICATLRRYGMEETYFNYCCTMCMSRKRMPQEKTHKLPDVCERYGVSLGQHHNALDDARACMELFLAMTAQQEIMRGERHEYHLKDRQEKDEKEASGRFDDLLLAILNGDCGEDDPVSIPVETPEEREKRLLWEEAFGIYLQAEDKRKEGCFCEAKALYDSALLHGYDAPAIYEGLVKMYRQQKDYQAELRICEEAARLHPYAAFDFEQRRQRVKHLILLQEEAQLKEQEKIRKAAEKEAARLRKQAEKSTAKPQRRPILQLLDDMTLVKEYASLADAIRETGINSKSLRDAANGKQIHAGGYRWKYKDQSE